MADNSGGAWRFGESYCGKAGRAGADDRRRPTALFEVLERRHQNDLAAALKHTVLIARSPQTGRRALKSLGNPTYARPGPNTWMDVVSTLDAHRPVNGLRVAVQEYGVSNRDLLTAKMKQQGSTNPYRSIGGHCRKNTPETGLEPDLDGHVQVILVTNAARFDYLIQVV